jgi:hypothetical protein
VSLGGGGARGGDPYQSKVGPPDPPGNHDPGVL